MDLLQRRGITASRFTKPIKCDVCGEVFLPRAKNVKTCNRPECRKKKNLERTKARYHQLAQVKKNNSPATIKDINFTNVTYQFLSGVWWWKAKFPNGHFLENGPFRSIKQAKKDMEEAINE